MKVHVWDSYNYSRLHDEQPRKIINLRHDVSKFEENPDKVASEKLEYEPITNHFRFMIEKYGKKNLSDFEKMVNGYEDKTYDKYNGCDKLKVLTIKAKLELIYELLDILEKENRWKANPSLIKLFSLIEMECDFEDISCQKLKSFIKSDNFHKLSGLNNFTEPIFNK